MRPALEHGQFHQTVLQTYLSISGVALSVKDPLLAERMLDAAYDHAARWNEHSQLFSKTLIDLDDQYQIYGRPERARELYWRAMRLGRSNGVDDWALARINDGLGQCYLLCNDFQNAKRFCRRALLLFEKLLGANNRLLAARRTRFAWVLAKLGEFEKIPKLGWAADATIASGLAEPRRDDKPKF